MTKYIPFFQGMSSASQTSDNDKMLLPVDPDISILVTFGWDELYMSPLHSGQDVLIGSA